MYSAVLKSYVAHREEILQFYERVEKRSVLC